MIAGASRAQRRFASVMNAREDGIDGNAQRSPIGGGCAGNCRTPPCSLVVTAGDPAVGHQGVDRGLLMIRPPFPLATMARDELGAQKRARQVESSIWRHVSKGMSVWDVYAAPPTLLIKMSIGRSRRAPCGRPARTPLGRRVPWMGQAFRPRLRMSAGGLLQAGEIAADQEHVGARIAIARHLAPSRDSPGDEEAFSVETKAIQDSMTLSFPCMNSDADNCRTVARTNPRASRRPLTTPTDAAFKQEQAGDVRNIRVDGSRTLLYIFRDALRCGVSRGSVAEASFD